MHPAATSDPEALLPLSSAVFHILLALADKERHGYAIMSEVAATTDGQIKLGPGTLYGTIKRLLAGRLIEESVERPDPEIDDERRRYYRLTDFGRRVLQAEVRRFSKMVRAAQTSGVFAMTPLAAADSPARTGIHESTNKGSSWLSGLRGSGSIGDAVNMI